ncbi:MAG: FKBP-type peptidyl-prolyl cis-trans isomerase [Planctomycetota bacterium]
MKRRNRKTRTRHNSPKLHFQQLEGRQLLAGDVAGPHQVEFSAPSNSNLVVNGDFEEFTAGADNFYNQNEVVGWLAKDDATGQEINLIPYQGYGTVLDLDSTGTDFDRVYQTIDTRADTEYVITFDFRSHTTVDPDATANTNDFQVWFGGNLVGQFSGKDEWQTGTIVVTSSGGPTELLFCELEEGPTNSGDSRGPFLDNIRLMETNPAEGVISNAGFETTAEDRTTFFRPQDVDGWAAFGDTEDVRFLKIPTNSEFTSNGTEGEQYLNLDSQSGHQDGVYQDLSTSAGTTYLVSFDYSTDGDQGTAGSNAEIRDEFRVRWDNAWAGTFFSEGDWRSVGLILTASSDTTRLTFLEPGEANGGDGSGALIDNVRVIELQSIGLEVDLNGNESGTAGTAEVTPGLGSQFISASATINDPSGVDVARVTVTLNNEPDGDNEVLGVVESSIPVDGSNNPLISVADYDRETNQLVLTGVTSADNYQTVLRTLVYFNGTTNANRADRSITFTVEDANANVETGELTVSFETDQREIDDAILQKHFADVGVSPTDAGDGLYVLIDQEGTGDNPQSNSVVTVTYDGKFLSLNDQNLLVEGSTFDAGTITQSLLGLIPGWRQGIPSFKTGGTGKLYIPSHLAYGTTGTGGIPPNSVLVFDIELDSFV